ncbi:MAG: hypothetical protein FD165_2674 [Gammaproteobacteria bacterium]|nr:MAG: hypothetical protein FD165_2674 [Gammaproteobacteria bacterium]TND01147.1 MAG: hypothetical protein FD120_2683 [Gammaproteobacteria bacterium]
MSTNIDTVIAVPVEVTPNDLVGQHGKTGWLIQRLQRYAMIGWLAFFALAAVFVGFLVVDKLIPVPVLAVDESGRVLGAFEYLSPTSRTDSELLAGAISFTEHYLSVNSDTVYPDYAAALSMMSEELRRQTLEDVKRTGYLAQVEKTKSRSYVEFYHGDKTPKIVSRRDLDTAVRLQGRLVITMNDQEIERPFDMTVDMTTIARNSLTTAGLVINAIRNN